MKNTLYFKILDYLSEYGMNQEVDISHLFDNEFTEPKGHELSALFHHRHYLINEFLKSIEKNGHIFLKDYTVDKIGTVEWIQPVNISANITKDGLDYYYSRALQIATIEANKGSLENYKVQYIGAWITGILSFVAALFSVLNFFKAEPKMAELNKNMKVLSKETSGIKQEMYLLRNQKTFHVDSSRKP